MRIFLASSSYVSEKIHVRSKKTSSTLSGFDSLPQTKKMMITMKFSWTTVTKQWHLSSSSGLTHCVSTDIIPLPTDQDSVVDLDIDQLAKSGSSHEIVNAMAPSCPLALGDSASQSLIEFALEQARETLNSNIVPRDHDRLYLDFRVVKQMDYHITDDDDQDELVEESNDIESDYDDLLDHLRELEYMSEFQVVYTDDYDHDHDHDYDYDDDYDYDYDDHGLMTRTDESSIESLEKKTADGELGNCVVCIEDYSSGAEVACMPCSHAFHEDCVKKWLRVSHYCPICRFDMPTICSCSGDDHQTWTLSPEVVSFLSCFVLSVCVCLLGLCALVDTFLRQR